jgi:hypothetical protein
MFDVDGLIEELEKHQKQLRKEQLASINKETATNKSVFNMAG